MSITCLLLVLEVRDGKPSYRKSWDVNFLVWLEFFIGPLLQDRARILFLLRKIALPYPHKCLLGFVEAKRGDQQEYLKIILVREVNPVVSDRCACAQHIVGWTLSRDPHSIFGHRGGNT